MADAENKGKVRNANNDAANWEARVRNELESSHKWNADWGEMYSNGIPFDYDGRIKYLEGELSKCPPQAGQVPKYGVGEKFTEYGVKSYKRKKLFQEYVHDAEEEEEKK